MHYIHESPRDFYGGKWDPPGEGLQGGGRVGGSGGAEPPGRRRSFQKICKKSMKNLAIF